MLSKIALGTVQFGLDYGITNNIGKVSQDEVRAILKYAKENGIDTLDTASGYGNSEEILGIAGVDNFQVVTKTTSLSGGINQVMGYFQQSLIHLNKKNVNGLLVHNINEIEGKEFNALFNEVNNLKQQGLVDKIGFSTYTPEQVDFLLDNFDFDLIQVPFNVFDNRLAQGGQLKALSSRGIEIHARSVFLQGVLLNLNNLSSYFSTWKAEFSAYQKMIKYSGLSSLEYAVNFAINTEEIDKVLVGVHSKGQLMEIVAAVKKTDSLKAHPINDINLLNPSNWKKP
jgi:aryl-alcohol dehydrogenase-like predicted oxidoreductase